MKHQNGFTLIELTIVITLIGIMAAVAVPKFFDFTITAHVANKSYIIGNIKTGLNNYAAYQIVTNGIKEYPQTNILEFPLILDEIPDGWTYDQNTGILNYEGDNSSWLYTSPVGGNSDEYTLVPQ